MPAFFSHMDRTLPVYHFPISASACLEVHGQMEAVVYAVCSMYVCMYA